MTTNDNVEETLRPTIAYVDEEKDERDNFYGDAFDSGLFHDILLLHPEQNMESFVEKILDLGVDALVTDFNLSEAEHLGYDGEKLVAALLAARSDFPCFIRTSFDEDALRTSDDVNRVYSKNSEEDEHAGRYLFDRIVMQIEHYKRKVARWQDELAELLQLGSERQTAAHIERIFELDTKIEASLGKDVAIPLHVKKKLLKKEDSLLKETERLVADIKRALGDQ